MDNDMRADLRAFANYCPGVNHGFAADGYVFVDGDVGINANAGFDSNFAANY